jgi:hypothetical protein
VPPMSKLLHSINRVVALSRIVSFRMRIPSSTNRITHWRERERERERESEIAGERKILLNSQTQGLQYLHYSVVSILLPPS